MKTSTAIGAGRAIMRITVPEMRQRLYPIRGGMNEYVNGNEAPTGIALTILAYNYFLPYKTVDYLTNASEYNDFFALKSMVENIQNAFTLKYDTESGKNLHSIELKLIVEPWNDLFEKMTAKQMDDFYNKIESMSKTLEEVDKEEKRNKACEKLQGIFGEDFPIKYDRSLVGTSESA